MNDFRRIKDGFRRVRKTTIRRQRRNIEDTKRTKNSFKKIRKQLLM